MSLAVHPGFWPVVLVTLSVPKAVNATGALKTTSDDVIDIRRKALKNHYPLNSIRLHARFGGPGVAGLIVAGVVELSPGADGQLSSKVRRLAEISLPVASTGSTVASGDFARHSGACGQESSDGPEQNHGGHSGESPVVGPWLSATKPTRTGPAMEKGRPTNCIQPRMVP